MAKCWPLQMPPSPKAVLISLADNANDEGHCWPSVSKIVERTCLSERTARSAIKWLCDHDAIQAIQSPGKASEYVITPATFAGVQPSQGCKSRTTPLQQLHPTPANVAPPYTLIRQLTVNEPFMSGKPDDARLILEFLNTKTGRAYRPVPANIRLITARLKEGATVDDCRMVIARKCREWKDSDMAKYLRPETLFNATKFAQYLGECVDG